MNAHRWTVRIVNDWTMMVFLVGSLTAMTCETPPPGPPPPPDATGGSGGGSGTGGEVGTGGTPTVEAFCHRLLAVGCPEGDDQQACVQQTNRILELPQSEIDLGCVANASSVAEVRACESVTCGGVR